MSAPDPPKPCDAGARLLGAMEQLPGRGYIPVDDIEDKNVREYARKLGRDWFDHQAKCEPCGTVYIDRMQQFMDRRRPT